MTFETDSERLDGIIADLAEEAVVQARQGIVPRDSRAILAATWVFTRCPQELQAELLNALDDLRHPWRRFVQDRRILLHGIGRTVSDHTYIRKALDLTLEQQQDSLTRACQSFLLSRRKEAPHVLDDGLARCIAEEIVRSLRGQLDERSFRQDFTYTLFVLTGLLRYREAVSDFLLVESSDEARNISRILTEILAPLRHPSLIVQAKPAKIHVVGELIKYLTGEESDPRLLRIIDEIS